MKFWIFGVAFLVPNVLAVAISLVDTFDWINLIDQSCNLSLGIPVLKDNSSKIEDASYVLRWISIYDLTWSFLMTLLFFVIFFIGLLYHINTKTMLRLLLEVSILVTVVGPIGNSGLFLRNCLTGYSFFTVSMLVYSIAIIITALTTELHFKRLHWKMIFHIILFIVITICKAAQIVAAISSFTLFLITPSDVPSLKYGYLSVLIVQFLTMWSVSIVNRWKYYHLFFHKELSRSACTACPDIPTRLRCVRVFDVISSFVSILCGLILIILTVIFYIPQMLYFVVVISLAISCSISLIQLLYKHSCVKSSADDDDDTAITPLISYD
jgi:hypothetical protein